ncbi:hypothetical protein FVB36_25330, partial [Escherichia coli]|nr:hypothetical protein [Escherichia coli]
MRDGSGKEKLHQRKHCVGSGAHQQSGSQQGAETGKPLPVLTPKSWTVKHEAYRSDSDIQLESD